MNRMVGMVAILFVTLLASESAAIDAPPGAIDLLEGVESLAEQFDAQKGQHRLVVLLSPA